MPLRFDAGRLGKAKRTGSGGVRVPARLTRAGVFEYRNPDGTIRREYRDPKEVFKADSLASLEGVPVTNLHPNGMVDPTNFAKLSVGHVHGSIRQDGAFVEAEVVVNDGYTISLIDKGERNEVSCGYSCEIDPTPGVTPDGERYDVRQVNICYNHLALVPQGRAGREVALRLDSDQNQIPPGEKDEQKMERFERIDGVDYEVDTDAHKAAVKRRDEEAGKAEARILALEEENRQLKGRADGINDRIEAAVQNRLALFNRAVKLGVEVKPETPEDEMRSAIASKVLPGVDLSGKSADFVEGAIAFAETRAVDQEAQAEAVRADAAPRYARRDGGATPEKKAPSVVAREKMIAGMTGRKDS